jgi:hypothetical protein
MTKGLMDILKIIIFLSCTKIDIKNDMVFLLNPYLQNGIIMRLHSDLLKYWIG